MHQRGALCMVKKNRTKHPQKRKSSDAAKFVFAEMLVVVVILISLLFAIDAMQGVLTPFGEFFYTGSGESAQYKMIVNIYADQLLSSANSEAIFIVNRPLSTVSESGNYILYMGSAVSLADQNVKPPQAGCGDGVCGALESCSSCSSDCGVCPSTPPSGGGGGGGGSYSSSSSS